MEHATFEEITHPGVDDAPVPIMGYMRMHACTTHILLLLSAEAATVPCTTVRQVRYEDAYQYQNIFGPLVKMEVPLSLPFLLASALLGMKAPAAVRSVHVTILRGCVGCGGG